MEDNKNRPKEEFDEPVEPMPEVKMDKIAIGAAILLGIFIGGIATFLYIMSGGTSQFMSDQDCNALVENASNISFASGIDYAVYQISISVLENGMMPRFINDSGVISIQYLQMNNNPNWTIIPTELNTQGGK